MVDPVVTPLLLARLKLPESHPEGPGTADVLAFLVRNQRQTFLVDTGVGRGNALIESLYEPEIFPLQDVLAESDISLGEITAIVNSHLHFDHCGNNSLFPGVPIYVQGDELEAAKQRHYTVPSWIDFPGARYVRIAGRKALSDEVEILPTCGHTPGHQSLLVHTAAGAEVVVAQAAYDCAEFERSQYEGFCPPDGHWSAGAYVSSLEMLASTLPRRAYFSHDQHSWRPREVTDVREPTGTAERELAPGGPLRGSQVK